MNSEKSWLIYAIVALNTLVFIAWNTPMGPGIAFMIENFLVSWDSLLEGRYWTLLTSVFSHNLVFHILMNMFVLLSFGPVVEQVLGTKRFLVFYLLAGIFGSLCHAVVSNFILHDPSRAALGASSSIAGVILLFSLLFPRQKILLLGIIPIPAILGAFAFIGLDIWGLMAQADGGGLPIGHGAHLGGSFVGILFFFYIKSRKTRRLYL